MDKISVLILTEYENAYYAMGDVELTVSRMVPEGIEKPYDIVFVDCNPEAGDMNPLLTVSQPHRVFMTERVTNVVNKNSLIRRMCVQTIESSEINYFLRSNSKYFFKSSHGDKFSLNNLAVSRNYKGSVKYDGNNSLILKGNFGEKLSQVLFFRNNVTIEKNQEMDFWLEYSVEGNVDISVEITAYLEGSISKVVGKSEFNSFMLNFLMTYGGFDAPVNAFVSVKARGTGSLIIKALHYRQSRGMNGHFLIGGERYVTQSGEEVFAYFEPGDLKPPFNIYFSGYKTREGFEGYEMMKRFGKPFLLIADARLEGGNFFLGDEEYTGLIMQVIRKYMEQLEFEAKDVIMSGLSMGAFGALYYACEISPYAVILGKPLANLGNIAKNEKLFRPSGFPTSLDILKKNTSSETEDRIEDLNNRLWSRYEKADWSKTKLIVAHLIEDDYDSEAYENMLSKMNGDGATIYGKGIHGRHNDNTPVVLNWFLGQFESVINEDFLKDRKG